MAAIGSAALEHAAGRAGHGRAVAVDEEAAAAAPVDEPTRHASSPLHQTALDAEGKMQTVAVDEEQNGKDEEVEKGYKMTKMSGYLHFSNEHRAEVTLRVSAMDLPPRERSQKIIKELGKMWKALSDADRADWKERAPIGYWKERHFIKAEADGSNQSSARNTPAGAAAALVNGTKTVEASMEQPLEYFFAVAGFGLGWLKEVRWPRMLPGQDTYSDHLATYHFDANDIPRLSALFRAGGRAALAAVAVVAVLRGFVVNTIVLPGVIVYRSGVAVGRWALGHCRADVGSVLKLLVACAAAGAFIFMIVGRMWQDALYTLTSIGGMRCLMQAVHQLLVPFEMSDCICDAAFWRSVFDDDWARLGDNKRRRDALRACTPNTMFVFLVAVLTLDGSASDPITLVDSLVVKELGLGAGVGGALGWMFVALRAVVALAGVRFVALLLSRVYLGCKAHGYALAWAAVIPVYNTGPPVPVLQFVGWGALAWAAYAFLSGEDDVVEAWKRACRLVNNFGPFLAFLPDLEQKDEDARRRFFSLFKFCIPMAVVVAAVGTYRADSWTGGAAFLWLCATTAVQILQGIFGLILILSQASMEAGKG